jgi:1,4-dihydroxy-2-naphthoyl-CoA hydrolase
MDALEFLRERKLAFAELMGIVFISAHKDKVVAELEVTPQLCTRPTTIHGGALMAFADTLGAAGTILNLPEGHTTARPSKARPTLSSVSPLEHT